MIRRSRRAGGRSGIPRVISAASAAVCHTNVVIVCEVHRVALAIQIPVEADPIGYTSAKGILLPEPIHLRLVESRAEVDHAGRGVVVFAVVAEAGSLFRKQLAKGRIRFAYDVLSRQSAAEGVPGVVVADLRSHRAASVVDIFRSGFACKGGDAFEAVSVVGRLAVLGSRDDHAVPIQNIPSERGYRSRCNHLRG